MQAFKVILESIINFIDVFKKKVQKIYNNVIVAR